MPTLTGTVKAVEKDHVLFDLDGNPNDNFEPCELPIHGAEKSDFAAGDRFRLQLNRTPVDGADYEIEAQIMNNLENRLDVSLLTPYGPKQQILPRSGKALDVVRPGDSFQLAFFKSSPAAPAATPPVAGPPEAPHVPGPGSTSV